MKLGIQKFVMFFGAALLISSTAKTFAFALLGPIQPWMQATNGVVLPGAIGGPMCLSNEYRWNIPVVNYGFEKSFLEFFGTNGVAAVEGAIKILNDLPPASELVLANYPFDSRRVNLFSQALSLNDLKSQTLSLLLEQLGLAGPVRNIFVLKQWAPAFITTPSENDWYVWAVPDYIVQRNFDPQTLEASPYVNGVLYSALVYGGGQGYNNFIDNFQVNPLFSRYSAVADFNLESGDFFDGLTCDDVGGLAYLLSSNNVNFETLIPGVLGVGTNANAFVNGAWRPGVEKVTFIPQTMDSQSGAFLPMTNYFTDSYITNGILQHQQVARIVARPDFLFSAGDVTSSSLGIPPDLDRTGTTNWLNNAVVNGIPDGAGPGVIQPPIEITFNKIGPQFQSQGDISDEQVFVTSLLYWASFDGSTNDPAIYPISQTGINTSTVRMWLIFGSRVNNHFVENFRRSFMWSLTGLPGATFLLQTSTNLTDWVQLTTIQNNGCVWTYVNLNPASASRFYRLIPQ